MVKRRCRKHGDHTDKEYEDADAVYMILLPCITCTDAHPESKDNSHDGMGPYIPLFLFAQMFLMNRHIHCAEFHRAAVSARPPVSVNGIPRKEWLFRK